MTNCHNNHNVIDSQSNMNMNNNSDIDSELSDNIDQNENNGIVTRGPSSCMCTDSNISHIEIKFFNKTTCICLNNKNDRCVVNLSSHNLSEDETSLLLKGLKFCPTPGKPILQEIKNDLKAFFRRLKLRAHYYEEDLTPPTSQPTLDSFLSNTEPPSKVNLSKFKPKGTWDPESEKTDPAIETFCRAILHDLDSYSPKCPRHNNLSEPENEALDTLKSKYAITIKKADKGSAVVVMDTSDYVREAERQLSDANYYVPKSENLTKHFCEKISETLHDIYAKGEIDHNVLISLAPTNKCRIAKFYFLPKIHKKLVVGRPIISGNGCPTEQISAFVDEHIKHYVSTFPSYVKDTTDFISKIRSLKTDKRIILVTMDVTSLYTNIPNQEGKTAVYRTLLQHDYNEQLSLDSLMKLLDHVLKMNCFEFNEKYYLQVGGTAMGTILAPSLANIFLGSLENKLLAKAPCKPDLYLRYIDDIFCVFTTSRSQVEEFIDFMNSQHNTIKFTADISEEEVTFLDTIVKVDHTKNEIYTDLHIKDTDTQNYLSFDSCHPKHCKTGGPYGEFLRIRRNCHKIEDYDKHSKQRVKDYERRGYPTKLLEEAREKARRANRDALLDNTRGKKKDNTQDRVPLIVTYNPSNPDLRSMVDKHWHLLQLCSNKEAFKEKPLVSYRRNKNLADHLVRAKCNNQNTRPRSNPNMRPCKTPWNCRFCPKSTHPGKFRSTSTGRFYKSPPYTCNTRNVIYLITCSLCKKQYVGESYRTFKERMIEHERYVKKRKYEEATGLHYNCGGHKLGHMNYEVIYCLWKKPIRDDPVRINTEIRWMEQLKTFKPKGLNQKGK